MKFSTNPLGIQSRVLVIAGVSALAFGLAACDNRNETATVGERVDNAVQQTEEAAARARENASQAMQSAEQKAVEGAKDVQEAGREAGAAIQQAGENAMDIVNDAAITASVNAGLAKDTELSALQINVDTKDGVVTLNGKAPTEDAKARATGIAQGVKGVGSVMNNLSVNPS